MHKNVLRIDFVPLGEYIYEFYMLFRPLDQNISFRAISFVVTGSTFSHACVCSILPVLA